MSLMYCKLRRSLTYAFLGKRTSLSKVTAVYDTASTGFNPEAYRILIIESEKLEAAAVKADESLAAQRTSMLLRPETTGRANFDGSRST